MHNVYEYVVDNQGIDTEASYPYKGRVRKLFIVAPNVTTEAPIYYPGSLSYSS